ncbi:ATP-binding cassette domain-containing protein [candidate division KSB3 bacterium]|uniref:ATP-binding cassette domain-containing protein n=1 Tax=candidate division KSB3 bacterium TaxID=2044937 RepID=A0A9D5Q596_9BACT|nr:ATP-binding cassette domain-containing protein [candidate division KSB3 bacterium]MBD3324027.1 ATP-binding cassette domain-containing protein [candidate division KSB3 bacterium]
MGNIAISVENLGKRYRIGQAERRPENLREALTFYASSPFRYLQSRLREPGVDEIIWALKDVSFEVRHGEVLGIIGRNGAGKSTLLKILSRITEPTEGHAKVYGRIGSLLEVGTGFHPELTGRENIYLNGAILGMRRAEIDRRFDEIVDFSGVERFLDTPVKRYSSGMRVRLAFAVAAHLNPEILLVDEVLAVGDVAFQQKCLGKMEDVALQEGRTVLFVSHNMGAIENLCQTCLYMEEGRVTSVGRTKEVIRRYLASIETQQSLLEQSQHRPGNGKIRLMNVHFLDNHNTVRTTFRVGETLKIEMTYKVYEPIPFPLFKVTIYSDKGTPIANMGTDTSGVSLGSITKDGRVICTMARLLLNAGSYRINIGIANRSHGNMESLDHVERAAYFGIQGGNPLGTGLLPDRGFVVLQPTWESLDS